MSNDFWLECKECGSELFSINITHNLIKMAIKSNLYKCIWKPDKLDNKKDILIYKNAKEMIPTLEKGLKKLKESPEYYKKFNPSNNWGNYEIFVESVEKILEACKKYPNAMPHTWI